jgi:hypothetical protein
MFSTVSHNSALAQKKTVPRYTAARFPIRPIRREVVT